MHLIPTSTDHLNFAFTASKDFGKMNRSAVIAEILDILEEICHLHRLPLALTWVSSKSLNSNKIILKIVDTGCYVNDLGMQGFVKACTRRHLEEGQGVAGKALNLTHHYSVPDVASLDLADYPYVDDAKSFGLRGAVAIKLIMKGEYRSNVDYVVEFFLPTDVESSEQKGRLDDILSSLRKKCENLKAVGAHGYNVQPVRLFGNSYVKLTSPKQNSETENLREIVPVELNGVGGNNEQPVRLFGNPNLNQISPEMNSENSSEMSFSEWNNIQPVSVQHSTQEVGDQNGAVEPAQDADNQLVVVTGDSQPINVNFKRRRVSEVWTAFYKIQENGQVWAICRGCNKRYPGESKKGTSNLLKHMKKCFRDRQMDTEPQPSPFVERSNLVRCMIGSNSVFNQDRSRMDIAKMVIKHGYPLNIVEHEFFEIFVSNLQPMFKFYSQDTVEADVLDVYKEEREKLGNYLDNLSRLFSLTIDLQSYDDRKVMYCCLTLHFIDDEWELKKKILAFKTLEYSCDMVTLHEAIKSVLMEWNIIKNVQFISAKSIPPIEENVGELKGKLCDTVLPRSGDLFYTSCHAHVLSLLVEDGFREIKSVLDKIRQSIDYVTTTPVHRQKFCEAINQLKIRDSTMVSRDVPTRWETTFLMLDRALELREVFIHLDSIDGDYKANLSTEEWERATAVFECLKVFHQSISNDLMSIDIYFENICLIYKNLLKWEKSEHVYIRSMTKRMKVKFDEYWNGNSLAFGILAILDPRFKFDLVEYAFEQIYNGEAKLLLKRFRFDLRHVYDNYANSSSYPGSAALSPADVSCSSYNPNSDVKHWGFNQWRKRKYDSNLGDSQKSELDQYLEEPSVNLGKNSDILAWWHANAQKLPTLVKMARDFLAIPVSAILSKSSFIDEVLKNNPALNGLSPEIVEALVCGQDWLESPKRSNSSLTRSEDDELEIYRHQHNPSPHFQPEPLQTVPINFEEYPSFLKSRLDQKLI